MLAAYLSGGAGGRATRCSACSRSASRSRPRGGTLHSTGVPWTLDGAGLQRARVQLARDGRPGAAALHRHDGIAEPARRRRDPRRRLRDADLEDHRRDRRRRRCCWRRSARSRSTSPPSPRRSAWAARRIRIRTGAGSRRRPAALIYCVDRRFGAAVAGLLAAFPRELVVAVAGLALLGHDRQRPGERGRRRALSRGGADHLPGHAFGPDARRHRLGLLGHRLRRARASCATVAARRPAPCRPAPTHAHEAALRRRPARDLQDLQGHDLRDDARGRVARSRAAAPASRATWCGSAAAGSARASARSRSPRRAARPGSSSAAPADDAGAGRRRRSRDAQGPAVRQRVLLRDAPARAGRARRRARLQQAARVARASGKARHPRVPAVHRADHRHPRRSRRSSASTPSTRTSS